MRVKLFQIGKFYVRIDLTVLTGFNVLLGFNYLEGVYKACTDTSLSDCKTFDYSEGQIGFLLFTLVFGIENAIEYEQHNT
jgi:hypothetical protein